MDFNTVDQYLLTFEGVEKTHPYDEKLAVYSVVKEGQQEPQMFALMDEQKTPIRISLKCDPKLSKLLRERYETVMPGVNLNQRLWNTVILTGQLPWEEVQGLIILSYNLTAKND